MSQNIDSEHYLGTSSLRYFAPLQAASSASLGSVNQEDWLPCLSTHGNPSASYSTAAMFHTYVHFMGETVEPARRSIFTSTLTKARNLFRNLDPGLYDKRGFTRLDSLSDSDVSSFRDAFVKNLTTHNLSSMVDNFLKTAEKLTSVCFRKQTDNLIPLLGPQQQLKILNGSGNFIFASRGDPVSCLLYTSPSPRDLSTSRMPSSA